MKISIDTERYDQLQLRLLEELVVSLRDGLREAGVDDADTLYEATGNLAFAVASIMDGSRVMDLDGADVAPVLTFARERDGEDLVAPPSGGSWMHEYVFGVVDDVFEQGDDELDDDDDDDDEDEDDDDDDDLDDEDEDGDEEDDDPGDGEDGDEDLDEPEDEPEDDEDEDFEDDYDGDDDEDEDDR